MTIKIDVPVKMKYYTRQESFELRKISMSTLDIYLNKGVISCSRVGKRVLFTQDDIDKALGKNRNI